MTSEIAIRELSRSIGKRIRTRRNALGLTQEQLAERSDLSTGYVAKLEVGAAIPSLATLYALAEALNAPLSELAGYEDDATAERARRLVGVFQGLSVQDGDFAERELVNIVAHLRSRPQ